MRPLLILSIFIVSFESFANEFFSKRNNELLDEANTANFSMNSLEYKIRFNSPLYSILPKGVIDDDSFSKYLHDKCSVIKKNVSNEENIRKLNLRRCNDGTVSFKQPNSIGYKGYEGKCGQTAASNIMYSYCKNITSPNSYTNKYLSDYTPGVRPGTLISGLDSMFNKIKKDCPTGRSWHAYSYDYESEYIDAIDRGLKTNLNIKNKVNRTRSSGRKIDRTPVALLIRNPGGTDLHWITVVDLIKTSNSCSIFVNHWDNQYKVPCSKIAKWSRGVVDSYGPVLYKYYVIKYK